MTEITFPLPDADISSHVTILQNPAVMPRALIFYLHGGGLLYGMRTDLPALHRKLLTEAGYVIAAMDYPLAPAADLPEILQTLARDITYVLTEADVFGLPAQLPFFLWGRSSGAYLALLLASTAPRTIPIPCGILSYYGYGFLTDGWADLPSPYYASLPRVPASCLTSLPEGVHTEGPMETHYRSYVYARQSGRWISLFYSGSEQDFRRDCTLQKTAAMPCPLFCTHAIEDPDVPFAEFQALLNRYHPAKYIASGCVHDFDRNENSFQTKKLMTLTLKFLDMHSPTGDSL